MVISLVTVGSTIVTINAKLLGGKVYVSVASLERPTSSELTSCLSSTTHSSFFQSLCVLGYCLAPLLLASILSFFFHAIYIRAPVSFLAVGWAVWGASYPLLDDKPGALPIRQDTRSRIANSSSVWPLTRPSLPYPPAASVNFLKGAKLPQSRQILAVYPLCLFYFVLAWMILIQ
jgi:hypothetical protein